MTLTFDGNGVSTSTYSEIFDQLDEGYKSIYGQDIDTDQESPDGQRIGIEATARFDLQQAFAWLYSQIDPDLNNGDMQQIIGKLSGTLLLPSSRSQWDLEITTDRALTLPVNYTISDQNNQEWLIVQPVSLALGVNNVTLFSKLWGAISGKASGFGYTQLKPELGVINITAAADSRIGREEETEEQFRLRRKRSLENPAQSTNGAIYAKLAKLPGVTDVAVEDNATNTYDQVKDLDARTMWAIVEGGELADIAEVMAKQRLGNTKGDVEVIYTEILERPDGSEFTNIVPHNIDRPEYMPLYVRMTARQRTAGSAVDAESIKNLMLTRPFFINESLQAGELYDYAYIENYNYIAYDLEVSIDDVVWTSEDLFSGWGAKFTLDAANIDITVINI